jgi:hypothetical protein
MGDREERARVAAGSKLPEDAAVDLEMPLDDEVHDVMGEPRVIARSRGMCSTSPLGRWAAIE